MTRAQRLKMKDNWTNKVQWGINRDGELGPCPHMKKVCKSSSLTKKALEDFRDNVNSLIVTTLQSKAPAHLKYGGFIVAVLIMIIGVVCLSQEEYAVGAVVVLLGFCTAFLGFWYRGQLVRKAWKKIGQAVAKLFKEMGDKYPGISYEFHVQGTHALGHIGNERTKKKKRRKKKKKGSKGGAESTPEPESKHDDGKDHFCERYIIIYLPGDASHFHDFVEDKRSVAAILKVNSQQVDERKDIIGGDPLILPYWWAVGKTADGKQYYINNLKHITQWDPPLQSQIEMEKAELNEVLAPPENDDDYSTDEDSD